MQGSEKDEENGLEPLFAYGKKALLMLNNTEAPIAIKLTSDVFDSSVLEVC